MNNRLNFWLALYRRLARAYPQEFRMLYGEDLDRLGELFYESHRSMRDDYQVSVAEIDLIVNLARSRADVYGARLTGEGTGQAAIVGDTGVGGGSCALSPRLTPWGESSPPALALSAMRTLTLTLLWAKIPNPHQMRAPARPSMWVRSHPKPCLR